MLFQPGILLSAFNLISCTKLADKKWISGDLNRECSEIWSATNLLIVLPIIFVELTVPLIVFIILYRGSKKNILDKPYMISNYKYIYGYFYIDYGDSIYYWEFVRMSLRLLIVISLSLFSSQANT